MESHLFQILSQKFNVIPYFHPFCPSLFSMSSLEASFYYALSLDNKILSTLSYKYEPCCSHHRRESIWKDSFMPVYHNLWFLQSYCIILIFLSILWLKTIPLQCVETKFILYHHGWNLRHISDGSPTKWYITNYVV